MCLLQIYIDSKLKDHIVDALLERSLNNFYYTDCNKYAAIDLLLSEREQVSGRKEYGSLCLFVKYDVAIELSEFFHQIYGKEDVNCFVFRGIERL